MPSLALPDSEDIAKAIWQRQREALGPDAIAYNVEWRDRSMPSKFWNEFLLDADAVLSLFGKKHVHPRDFTDRYCKALVL